MYLTHRVPKGIQWSDPLIMYLTRGVPKGPQGSATLMLRLRSAHNVFNIAPI